MPAGMGLGIAVKQEYGWPIAAEAAIDLNARGGDSAPLEAGEQIGHGGSLHGRRLIANFGKEKAFGRRGWAGGASGPGCQGSRHILRSPAALAHQLQRAHHVAYLMMQERTRGGVNANLLARALHIQPIQGLQRRGGLADRGDRKSTRLNSSHSSISYAVFCLKKKKKI